jgi:hypothetical protein
MKVNEKGYYLNLEPLVRLVGRLNGADGHKSVNIRGMFFRVQDFETSSRRLLRQLYAEGFAANKHLGKGYEALELAEKLKDDGIRLKTYTSISFDTYDLSPMLRHFINDACRVLEPMVKLLSHKYPAVPSKVGNNRFLSFNTYLKHLENRGINTGLANRYFYALYYELWNDYKHAESTGIHAGNWCITNQKLIKEPILRGERLKYFSTTKIEEFINMTFDNLNEVLNVTR